MPHTKHMNRSMLQTLQIEHMLKTIMLITEFAHQQHVSLKRRPRQDIWCEHRPQATIVFDLDTCVVFLSMNNRSRWKWLILTQSSTRHFRTCLTAARWAWSVISAGRACFNPFVSSAGRSWSIWTCRSGPVDGFLDNFLLTTTTTITTTTTTNTIPY